jgi:DUF1680 family protein
MPVRRVYAHPNVAADRGRVALQRGPLIYCIEGIDNGIKASSVILPPKSKLTAEFLPDMLGGVTVIKGTALAKVANDWGNALYSSETTSEMKPIQLLAIPFFANSKGEDVYDGMDTRVTRVG